ncbi:hypothetical protein I8D64_03170 [Brachybacterium sp. MASK1Z-5]|uniref:Secreted protein n=1 Tax=Brachybacterium halotolerans TaxID=2795215 RepID=A0ABS1B6W6_9MICO|nr:hypothetical protein [Brachybacterium halotolerans]MBK0330399.1 hypothetical protein [Brachybacterium halotolerans]
MDISMKSATSLSARRAVAIVFAVLVMALPGQAFAAGDEPASSAPQATDAAAQQTWVAYDGNHITSAAGCERRRTWLIDHVDWVKRPDTACWKYQPVGCPKPKPYWQVMVRDRGAKLMIDKLEVAPAAAPAKC